MGLCYPLSYENQGLSEPRRVVLLRILSGDNRLDNRRYPSQPHQATLQPIYEPVRAAYAAALSAQSAVRNGQPAYAAAVPAERALRYEQSAYA